MWLVLSHTCFFLGFPFTCCGGAEVLYGNFLFTSLNRTLKIHVLSSWDFEKSIFLLLHQNVCTKEGGECLMVNDMNVILYS